jgi:hypothetical protein
VATRSAVAFWSSFLVSVMVHPRYTWQGPIYNMLLPFEIERDEIGGGLSGRTDLPQAHWRCISDSVDENKYRKDMSSINGQHFFINRIKIGLFVLFQPVILMVSVMREAMCDCSTRSLSLNPCQSSESPEAK